MCHVCKNDCAPACDLSRNKHPKKQKLKTGHFLQGAKNKTTPKNCQGSAVCIGEKMSDCMSVAQKIILKHLTTYIKILYYTG